MRILLSAVGTRGDVQPILALATQIRAFGHEPRLCIPPNFVQQAKKLGFDPIPVGIEMRAPRKERPPPSVSALITDQFDVVGAAAQGCDLIVAGGAHQYAARSAAELHGLPYAVTVYAPVAIPSLDLPPPGQPAACNDTESNSHAWREYRLAWNNRALEEVNDNRASWGLAPIDDVLNHVLADRPWLAADPVLGPTPSTPQMRVRQTGLWSIEDRRSLPSQLEAFLADGEAPIYFGFGSMPAPRQLGATLLEAARKLGRRCIISRGWAELTVDSMERDCIVIDEVNHQALFPRAAAVVHHGGAGTTYAAARAGTPQVIIPMFSDQFYWGWRVCALQIGRTLSLNELNVQNLSVALRAALDHVVSERCKHVSKQLVVDGAATAARQLLGEIR